MTLRKVAKNGKLIALFGCGGNRDKTKRPKMMRICLDNADEVIITDDNPRFEEPHDIRRDIISELEMKNIAMKSFEIGGKRICDVMNFEADDKICYEIKGTRSDAIKYGISIMNDGDVLLIAGKGHEDYQIIKGTKYHFSDQEEVIECFGN
jgi:UDP-N-acetylmuramoyl-L-alanyl-D-glutamate--2,6-diaminopimelate ligase